jgi:predicted kinase
MAQDVAALKKAVKELRDRVNALEGDAGLDGVRQEIRELRSDNDAMFKILLRQREDDRALADQRRAQIMGRFEKLFSQPPEN